MIGAALATRMRATAPPALLWFVAGFTVWSVALVALYAVQALGCEWGWHLNAVGPVSLQDLILGSILFAHIAMIAILSVVAWRWWRVGEEGGPGAFVRVSSVALTLAALVATAWIGFPAVVLTACVA
jgi:hypothetical protein